MAPHWSENGLRSKSAWKTTKTLRWRKCLLLPVWKKPTIPLLLIRQSLPLIISTKHFYHVGTRIAHTLCTIKHEYLRSRASKCLSLASPFSSDTVIQLYWDTRAYILDLASTNFSSFYVGCCTIYKEFLQTIDVPYIVRFKEPETPATPDDATGNSNREFAFVSPPVVKNINAIDSNDSQNVTFYIKSSTTGKRGININVTYQVQDASNQFECKLEEKLDLETVEPFLIGSELLRYVTSFFFKCIVLFFIFFYCVRCSR